MLKGNDKGFVLLEIIVSLSLLMLFTSIIIPIVIQVKTEQAVLHQRFKAYHHLYNVIQIIEPTELPYTELQAFESMNLSIDIYLDNDLIVAEGVWHNVKDESEKATVYFKQPK